MSFESAHHPVGQHEISFTPPFIVTILWNGDVSVEDATRVKQLFAKYEEMQNTVWVTDLSKLGKMPFAAAAVLAKRELPDSDQPRRMRCAFAGANLRTKIAMQLVLSLARFATHDKMSAYYFDTLEQTQAWARREAPRPEGP